MRFIRIILICLAVTTLLSPGVSDAVEPFTFQESQGGPVLTVTLEKNVVYVKNGEKTVQKILYDEEDMMEEKCSSSEIFSAVDMNFDGFLDLRVAKILHAPNIYYFCYLWDPEDQRFKENEFLEEIPNLAVDRDSEKITAFCHESAMDNWEGEYSWSNGGKQLVLTYCKTQRYREKADLFLVTEERLNDDGAMTTISENYFSVDHENGCAEGRANLDDETLKIISEAVKELLGSAVSGDEEFHAESVTDGKDVTVWLFSLKNGDIACFEVADDRSGLYLNRGFDKGTFRVNLEKKITLGDRVD